MHRLFIAIRPPAEIRSQLSSLMGGVAGARWQSDDQLHLTLRFVGEADRHQANDLAEALGEVMFAPFAVTLSGLGQFERKGQVSTLWAGVQPREPIAHLHRKIDRACNLAGFPPDERAYLPHITLARLNRGSGSTQAFLTRHGGFSTPPFRVGEFTLFESHLTSSGAQYEAVALYRARSSADQPD